MRKRSSAWVLGLALVSLAGVANARGGIVEYDVTITNVTQGQTFTPILTATHQPNLPLFELGHPASEALEILAEGGDTAPLSEDLLGLGSEVGQVQTRAGLLGPGESATIRVEASRKHRNLSLAAMLIPTNDTFVALNSVPLPMWGSRVYLAAAYDAGTEEDDQSCANIPGPRCGGEGYVPGPAEGDVGHVHISNGFHELGMEDAGGAEVLGPQHYDWRNPVARIHVERVR